MTTLDDFNNVSGLVREHISETLARVAAEEGVRILYAAESGSRAWGFASPDSDYDVRFIYAHPRAWYLSLAEQRDVIERPLDDKLVDLAGWDLRKALRLLLKSNPAFYEWLTSPIVYRDDGVFRDAAKSLFERHADPKVLAHAYHSIAKGQFSGGGSTADTFKLKRYLYAVRPVLSLQWLAMRGTLPPMNLQELMEGAALPVAVRDAILNLLERKRTTPELGHGARIPVLEDWLRSGIATLAPKDRNAEEGNSDSALREADALFARIAGL